MTMHCFCSGELIRDPERRSSAKGTEYTAALLRVDAENVVNLTAFDSPVCERLASLRKGAALACSGRLSAKPYTAADGALRAGLSVTVTDLMAGAMPPTKAAPRTVATARSDRLRLRRVASRSTTRCRSSERSPRARENPEH